MIKATGTELRLESILPRINYLIQICEDRAGISTPFSAPTFFCLPPQPPTKVTVQQLNVSTYRIEWELSNLPGDEYLVDIYWEDLRQHSIKVALSTMHWEGQLEIPVSAQAFVKIHAVNLFPASISTDYAKAKIPHQLATAEGDSDSENEGFISAGSSPKAQSPSKTLSREHNYADTVGTKEPSIHREYARLPEHSEGDSEHQSDSESENSEYYEEVDDEELDDVYEEFTYPSSNQSKKVSNTHG